MKRWLVECEVNMDASREVSIIVKANTERKAESKAINECFKKGYFYAKVISIGEME